MLVALGVILSWVWRKEQVWWLGVPLGVAHRMYRCAGGHCIVWAAQLAGFIVAVLLWPIRDHFHMLSSV